MNTLAGEIIRPNRTNLVCRWQSRGGKYWVELWHDQFGYFYRTDNGGGFMGEITFQEAIAKCEQEASFAPSKLRRVASGV
jgi:hypothetical protein